MFRTNHREILPGKAGGKKIAHGTVRLGDRAKKTYTKRSTIV
jgi:hypothetical protein